MNKFMTTLMIVTCVVVLAVAYLWFSDRQAAIKSNREIKAQIKDSESKATLERCREIVSAWERGDRKPAERMYGDRAEGAIGLCQTMMTLSTLRPTPSE